MIKEFKAFVVREKMNDVFSRKIETKKFEELLVPFSPSRQRRADWDRNKVIRVGLD